MFSLQTIFGQGHQFYSLLEDAAVAAHDAAKALHAMLREADRQPALDAFKLARLREREASDKISQALVDSFITPIEREDIEALGSALYKIPKQIERFADRYVLAQHRLVHVDFAPRAAMLEKAAGVVVDDTVLVGSANWVDNSMEENRELMMAIRSEGTASTYSSWFQDDWVGDALPPAIALPWHHLNVREGEPIVLDATGCHDPSGISGFHWDLDGDGVPDVQGPLQVVSLPRGTHRIGLKVTDILGNSATEVVYVTVSPGGNGAGAWMLYAPLPAAMLLLFIRSRHRRI